MACCCIEAQWLPIATAVFLPGSFLVTYLIAVLNRDVSAGFPYISDTGTIPPESCVFGQLLSIAAILIGVTVYLRCQQIRVYCEGAALVGSHFWRFNTAATVIGFMAACGVSIVGNFQETNVDSIHIIGALLSFGLGNVYAWLQIYISYKLYPALGRLALAHMRVVLTVISTVCFFIFGITHYYAKNQFRGDNPRKWSPDDGGFTLHICSTATEWIMSIFFSFYFITFSCEFSQFRVQHMTIVPVHDAGENERLVVDV